MIFFVLCLGKIFGNILRCFDLFFYFMFGIIYRNEDIFFLWIYYILDIVLFFFCIIFNSNIWVYFMLFMKIDLI